MSPGIPLACISLLLCENDGFSMPALHELLGCTSIVAAPHRLQGTGPLKSGGTSRSNTQSNIHSRLHKSSQVSPTTHIVRALVAGGPIDPAPSRLIRKELSFGQAAGERVARCPKIQIYRVQ